MRKLILLLLVCFCQPAAQAALSPDEVPDWVVAGIAAIETGSDYRDGRLTRYRDQRDGPSGEVGPWQVSPAVLRDLGLLRHRHRVRRDVVLAEDLARRWLVRCYQRSGDWDAAVAAYHVGPRGDAARGQDYAEKVRRLGMSSSDRLDRRR